MQPAANLSTLYDRHGPQVSYILERVRVFLQDDSEEGEFQSEDLRLAAGEWPVDELCALKFFLSAMRRKHNDADKAKETAVNNLITSLKWRASKAELLRAARLVEKPPFFSPYTIVELPHYVVYFQQLGNMNTMLRECDNDTKRMHEMATSVIERISILLDEKSRATGRLCKSITVLDIGEFAAWSSLNMSVLRVFSQMSKDNDTHRPQLTESIIYTNVPSMFRAVMKMFTPWFPKATLEKQKLCMGKNVAGKNCEEECPFVRKHLRGTEEVKRFPVEFGGRDVRGLSCEGGGR